MKLEYSEINERFGLLGTLVNDFFSLGAVTHLAVKGPLTTEGLSWFMKLYLNDAVDRAMLGVSYSLKLDERSSLDLSTDPVDKSSADRSLMER